MKNLLYFLILILPFSVFAQNNSDLQSQIDSLINLQKEYTLKFALINQQIKDLENKKAIAQLDNMEGLDYLINQQLQVKIRDKSNTSGNVIFQPKNGTTIKLMDFDDLSDYWIVSYNNRVGYVSEILIQVNPTITEFKNNLLLKKASEDKEQNSTAVKARKERLEKQYEIFDAAKIIGHQYWIGMTASAARESLGSPDDINSSTGSWGVHEQWVYERRNLNLYFENGKLTSWQE